MRREEEETREKEKKRKVEWGGGGGEGFLCSEKDAVVWCCAAFVRRFGHHCRVVVEGRCRLLVLSWSLSS